MRLVARALLFLLSLATVSAAEEGMYPVNDLQKFDLKNAGFTLSARTIFNPDSISLTDAVVNIGGCTGSFISAQGLILTNHHCAFSAIQRASSKEHDYLQQGF
ncbi:MAG TPA: S46 family peptidase, partial [bacterium]|nr:S46 family peptidase [bacterium]